MQNLLEQAQSELDLQLGEFSMFVLDMPALPAQSPSVVMVAQAKQVTRSAGKAERVMGVCYVVPNVPERIEHYNAGDFPSQSMVYPYEDASAYFREFEHRDINIYEGNVGPLDKSTSTILQLPKHGILIDAGLGKYQAYYYKPDDGYFGKDFAVIETEINGLKVKINYYFHSLDTGIYQDSDVCGKKWPLWRISLPDTPLDAPTIQTMLSFAGISSGSFVQVKIANLSGSAVGSAQGTTITLDDNP